MMEMTAIERQEHFIKLAATHADDFKTRVTQHDRENSFPFENIQAMKASGYLNMTLPAELGGGGADPMDLVLAQERLARGDGPTAVAINMHIFNVAVRSDLWRLGDEKQRPFLEASARDSLILPNSIYLDNRCRPEGALPSKRCSMRRKPIICAMPSSSRCAMTRMRKRSCGEAPAAEAEEERLEGSSRKAWLRSSAGQHLPTD